MTESNDAAQLLAKVKVGDQQAATDLFHRFANRLVGLVRSRLDLNLRRKVDPEDIMQSVFVSFFRRHDAGEVDIQSWESLWSLLAVITVHKCGHKIRYYRAAKRNTDEERSAVRYTDDSAVAWEAVAKEPTASQAAMFNEALAELMKSLETRERQILTLHFQGYPVEEISQQVKRSERTVRRVLDRIRNQLEADACEKI